MAGIETNISICWTFYIPGPTHSYIAILTRKADTILSVSEIEDGIIFYTGKGYVFSAGSSLEFSEGSNSTVGIKALGVDAPVGIVHIIDGIMFAHPGDNETTINKRRDGRVSLIITGIGIGSKLIANFVAGSIINLTIETELGAILIVGVPGNDIAVIIKNGHLRIPLMVVGVCINPELFTDRSSVNIIALSIDTFIGSVLVRFPSDNEAAITEAVDGWIALTT